MRIFVRTLAVALAFGAFGPAASNSGGVAAPLPGWAAEADLEALAVSPFWQKLLRYQPSAFSPTGVRSDIVSPRYFFDVGGATDPLAELRATVAAMSEPVTEGADLHAQCRFPGRFLWLRERLEWPREEVVGECPDFERWSREGEISSISVILASGHLSNPASFYGHILLKFNHAGESASDDFFSTSLNYGAVIPEDENGLVYVARGVFGGYRSTFTHREAFYHEHDYAEAQLRDLWEYELALEPGEVDLLVAHTWELLGTENTYYFFKQNCAYRMAELLNVVIERPLLPVSKAWAMPLDVFHGLSEPAPGARQLIRAVRRRPSRQSAFGEGFRALSSPDRQVVIDYARGGGGDIEARVAAQDARSQARILEVLLDYYSLVASAPDGPTEESRARVVELQAARLRRPPRSGPAPDPDPTLPPHRGQRSSLLQLGPVYNEDLGAGALLRFRGAFYDFLSVVPKSLPESEVAMADLELLLRPARISLRRLDLIRISTLNLSASGLPHDGGNAWSVRIGAESRDLSCDRCTMALLEGALGRSVAFGASAVGYALATARTTAFHTQGSALQLGGRVGLVFGGRGSWKALAEAGVWQQLDGRQRTQPLGRFELRWGTSPHWDLRAGVAYQEAAEGRLSAAYYW